jgi:hypothetical protein
MIDWNIFTNKLGNVKMFSYICRTKWESGWSHHLIKPNEWPLPYGKGVNKAGYPSHFL